MTKTTNNFAIGFLLLLSLTAAPCKVLANNNIEPPNSGLLRIYPGPIKTKLTAEYNAGKNKFTISITNSSNEFFCMDAKMTDPIYQHIFFRKNTGELVALNIVADSSMAFSYKFDYNESFVFLRPNETRKVERDFNNFDIGAGDYTYETTFLYYRCKDIIDLRRLVNKKRIKTYLVHDIGRVSLR